jgi:hypothetical protein
MSSRAIRENTATLPPGWYYDPEQPGWGLRIDIIPGGKLIGAIYYHLPDGGQGWAILGEGHPANGIGLLRARDRGLPGLQQGGGSEPCGTLRIDGIHTDGSLQVRLELAPAAWQQPGPQFSPMPSPHVWSGKLAKLA